MFLNFSPRTLGLRPLPVLELPAFARQAGFEGPDLPLPELKDAATADPAVH